MDPNVEAGGEGSTIYPIMDQSEWISLETYERETVRNVFNIFFPDVNFENNLSKLTGPMLASLKQKCMPYLFQETLPQHLSDYISRRVNADNIISTGIFELVDITDIFLFDGMSTMELSKLIEGKLISTSGEQLKVKGHPLVNFMTLNEPGHFIRVCQKTNEPVHLIGKWSDGKLRWMRSRGSIRNIKKHFSDDGLEGLDEETFCKDMSMFHTASVCISANPGMGKSVLLSQIARRLRDKSPDLLILYISMKELVNLVKLELEDIFNMTEAIAKSLQNLVCVNSFEEVVLQSILSSERDLISIELMLDGLDEVGSIDFKLALDILQTIQGSFKSVRLWVAIRPYLLKKLESNLNFVLVKILPFTHQDQLNFLESFWSRSQSSSLDKQRLKVFAQDCLQSLELTLSSIGDEIDEDDIAGDPIHCVETTGN